MLRFFRNSTGTFSCSLIALAFFAGNTSLAEADSARAASVAGSVSGFNPALPDVAATPGRGGPAEIGGFGGPADIGGVYSDPRFYSGHIGGLVLDERTAANPDNDRRDTTFGAAKSGVALFSTNAGIVQIEFNYSGRFHGKFEDHTAGFRLRVKIPPF